MTTQARVKCVATVRRGGLSEAAIRAAVEAQFPTFEADVRAAIEPLEPAVVIAWHCNVADLRAEQNNTWQVYPKCNLSWPTDRPDAEVNAILQAARAAIVARLETLVGGQGWTQVGNVDIQLYGGA